MTGVVSKVIRDNLGERTLKKIEGRLTSLFNLSVDESFLKFEKLDIVLREFFGEGAQGLEKKIIDAIHKSGHRKN